MKNKMIICTVGTSIANGCDSQKELLSKKSNWNDESKQLESEIAKRIQQMEINSFRQISAEINSIDRLNITSDDKIVLLSSDNVLGKICSFALKDLLSKRYLISEQNIIVERIEGLQVYDSILLKKIGLKNLITVV